MLEEFKSAVKKAQEVNQKLKRKDGFANLTDLVNVVKDVSGFGKITVSSADFSEIKNSNDVISNAGAMLSTVEKDGKKEAFILLNSKKSAPIQRFSVAHELGHLVTNVPNYVYETPNDSKYTLSTLINPDITYISEDKCKDDKYNLAEQAANIFALMVLIPDKIKVTTMLDNDVEDLMEKYGVVKEAIYSRMILSATVDE